MHFPVLRPAPLRRDAAVPDFTGVRRPITDALELAVTLQRLHDRDALEASWRGLAASAHGSFFLTWDWIGTWLDTLPAATETWVLEARRAGLVVGLAILTRHRRATIGPAGCDSWTLHATGVEALDVPYIQYNDFLVHPGDAPAIRAAMFRHWLAASGPRAEIALPGVRPQDWAFMQAFGLAQQHAPRPCWILETQTPGGSPPDDLTSLLGPHTRRNIRRSLRDYQERGTLAISAASDPGQALAWFDELVALNSRRLTAKGKLSNCASEHFQRFHRHLLSVAPAAACMLRIDLSDRPLGYLYAFLHRSRAYAYQCGFVFEADNSHARPGYVSHLLAARLLASAGYTSYDFMAGKTAYKASLSNQEESLDWVVAHKPHWCFRMEDWLRHSRTHLKTTAWACG